MSRWVNYWTPEKDALLRSLWGSATWEVIHQVLPEHSKHSISRRACRLKLLRDGYRLKSPEVEAPPEWIIGELLGDGHLTRDGQYQHSSKYDEYIRFLEKKLVALGIKVFVRSTCKVMGEKTFHGCRLYTRAAFRELRRKWYSSGKKRVPQDMELTPTVLLHWFIGDGSVSLSGSRCSLGTMGYDDSSLALLRSALLRVGVQTTVCSDRTLYLKKTDTAKSTLSKILELEVPECYLYKMNRLKLWLLLHPIGKNAVVSRESVRGLEMRPGVLVK